MRGSKEEEEVEVEMEEEVELEVVHRFVKLLTYKQSEKSDGSRLGLGIVGSAAASGLKQGYRRLPIQLQWIYE